MDTLSESDLKAKVIAIAKANGWRVFHMGSSARMRKAAKGDGYPDLTCARDGEVLWIECKAEEGKLSPEQSAWMVDLWDRFHVIRPVDLVNGSVHWILR